MPKRNIHRDSNVNEPGYVDSGNKKVENHPRDDVDDDIPRPRGYTMSYGAAWYKVQMKWKISILERKKKRRKEQFGQDYLKLTKKKNYHYKKNTRGETGGRANHEDDGPHHDDHPNNAQAREVFRDAMYDILSYTNEIQRCRADLKARIIHDIEKKRSIGSKRGDTGKNKPGLQQPSTIKENTTPRRSGGDGRGGRGRGGPSGGRGRGGRGRGRGPGSHIRSPGRLPKQVVHREDFQPRHSPEGKRVRFSLANQALMPAHFQSGPQIDKWTHSEWWFKEYETNGGWTTTTQGLVETVKQTSIQTGIQTFKKHPQLFVAMLYPNEMLTWPEAEQEYTLIYRDGTTGLKPKGVKKSKGAVTLLVHEYVPLPPLPNDMLPKRYRDVYTDEMKYKGKKLITKNSPAFLPGRGTGLMDDPSLKLMGVNGVIDPSDIAQGSVGDCWLLSGIAALAEFEGAIARLFRNTKDLHQLPYADGRPNQYTVTLWNLNTWTEVDITVDERLPARQDPPGALFGAKATLNGELWVAYLEKAIVAHCGGWDAIEGGQCTHAWSLLTGCREQYIIQNVTDPSKQNGTFGIWAKYDSDTKQWARHENSPNAGPLGISRVDWPVLGGGGTDDLSEDSLFIRMCIWNDNNYLIGASSKGESDRNNTNGVVDNHAYSVIDCKHNVAGTGISMARVRNPWGYGGIDHGLFARGGKGWTKYPEIRKALEYKELEQDDGVFWVTKEEFFRHYRAIYLGAMDMHKFLGISPRPRSKGTNQPVFAVAAKKLPPAPSFDSDSDSNSDSQSPIEIIRKEETVVPGAKNTVVIKEDVPAVFVEKVNKIQMEDVSLGVEDDCISVVTEDDGTNKDDLMKFMDVGGSLHSGSADEDSSSVEDDDDDDTEIKTNGKIKNGPSDAESSTNEDDWSSQSSEVEREVETPLEGSHDKGTVGTNQKNDGRSISAEKFEREESSMVKLSDDSGNEIEVGSRSSSLSTHTPKPSVAARASPSVKPRENYVLKSLAMNADGKKMGVEIFQHDDWATDVSSSSDTQDGISVEESKKDSWSTDLSSPSEADVVEKYKKEESWSTDESSSPYDERNKRKESSKDDNWSTDASSSEEDSTVDQLDSSKGGLKSSTNAGRVAPVSSSGASSTKDYKKGNRAPSSERHSSVATGLSGWGSLISETWVSDALLTACEDDDDDSNEDTTSSDESRLVENEYNNGENVSISSDCS